MNWSANDAPTARHYITALGICALTTVLTLPLLGLIDLANIVLLFVLAVVLVAARLGRGPAVLSSFAAVACFDFFFVPPRFSFTVAHAQYLITFAVMLLVSLIVSHLTDAYRRKTCEAERRAGESALLHQLAGALLGALTVEQVAERLDEVCGRLLAAGSTLFIAADDGKLAQVNTGSRRVDIGELTTASVVFHNRQATHLNTDLRDGMITVLQPLDGTTRRRGVLALHFSDDDTPRDQTLLSAVAAVVTTAIERIHFVEVAHASTLDMQTERLRSSILSALSHDLRTPLTVLYGLADSLVCSGRLDADQQATAATLRDQSHRMHRMVDNLLDMARLRSGRIVLRRDWQSIPELVGASVRAMTPWLDPGRLRFDWPADLPLVEIDAVLMERVFCNLLENAIKYSPPDTTIDVGARVCDQAGGAWLQLWFDNPGQGFPPEKIDRVFNLFERGPTESPVPGVGVGLAVCRAIVEAHRGSIVALNRTDGARVLIELPIGDTPAVPAEGGADEHVA